MALLHRAEYPPPKGSSGRRFHSSPLLQQPNRLTLARLADATLGPGPTGLARYNRGLSEFQHAQSGSPGRTYARKLLSHNIGGNWVVNWSEPEEDFGTQLSRYLERKEMGLEHLAQVLQALGYPQEIVHPEVMLNAITDREGHHWRNRPWILRGIVQVLELDRKEEFHLTNAYLYRPPDRFLRERRRQDQPT